MFFARNLRKFALIAVVTIAAYFAIPPAIEFYKSHRKSLEIQPAEESKAAQELLAQMTPEQQREYLATLYRALINQEKSGLSSLKVYASKFGKEKAGYVIYAEHSTLTKQSFGISMMARKIEYWINLNGDALKKAGVVKVGVRSDASEAGAVFTVK